MIYYLSGPMRGYPEYNYPAFHAAEDALYKWAYASSPGLVITNPAKNFGGDQSRPLNEYMQIDIQSVLDCDKVVLLPGWEDSEGANLEVAVAKATGKQFVLAELYQECKTDQGTAQDWRFTSVTSPDRIKGKEESHRASLLNEARTLVTGDRNNSYGPPTQDFQRSAGALNAYGYRGPDGRELAAHDIAIMVMAVKLSRLMWTPQKRDSWVDVAGYAACGFECAMEEAK